MSAMENQVVRIFERKKRIIEQARQQCHIWEHHIHHKLVLSGISPPPWLCNSALHSDPKELNQDNPVSEVLISESQFRVPFSGRDCSLYSNLCAVSDDVQYPIGLHSEVHALRKDCNTGDDLPNLPDCSVNNDGCASTGAPELDAGAISPLNQIEPRASDSYHDPALSRAKLQRSKSRQKALELRNSAKATKPWLESDNNAGVSDGTVTGCVSSALHADHVEESDLVKDFNSNIQSCSLEEVRTVDCIAQTCEKSYSGHITKSKSLAHNSNTSNVSSPSVVKEDGCPSYNLNEPLDLISRPCFTNGSCEVKEASKGECQRKEAGSSAYDKRFSNSKSFRQASNSSDILKVENTSGQGNGVEVHDFMLPPAHVDLTGLSKASDQYKVKDGDLFKSKEDCDIRGGKSLLRNPCPSPGDNYLMTGGSVKSINQSVQSAQPLISKHSQELDFYALKAKEHLSTSDTGKVYITRDSKSQNHIEEESKFISSNFCGQHATCPKLPCNHSPNVRLAELDARRISSSENDSKLDAEIVLDSAEKNTETVIASGDTRAEKVLAPQENILNGANPTIHIDDRSAANVAKTDADLDSLVEKGPSCFGRSPKIGLDVSALRLPSDFVKSVMPKQLDFDDVEESSMNASSSPDLKDGQQGMSPEEEPLNLLEPENLVDEESSLACQGKCNSSEEMHSLEVQEAQIITAGPQIEYCSSHFDEADVVRKAISAFSPNRELPLVQNEFCILSSSLMDHISPSQIAGENLSGGSLKEVMTSKCVSGNDKLENDESSAMLVDALSTAVVGNDLHKYTDGTVTAFTVGFPATALMDEVNVGLTPQAPNSISLCKNGDLLKKKSLSDGKNTGLSTNFQIFESSIERFTYDLKHSSPQHKKRKIDFEIEKFPPASSKLEKSHDSIEQKSVSRNLSIEKENLKAALEVQHLTSFQEDDARHAYVSSSKMEETQGTGECQTVEGFTHEVRKVEKLFVDGRDGIADHLLFAEANLSGFTVDSTMSHTMEEKVESWQHKVDCGQEIAEHLTCAERGNSGRRINPEGNAKFSDGSSASPGIQCLNLNGTDDTVPEFEGFIMETQTDNTQPCTAGDQMEMEKTTLPSNSFDCTSLGKSRFMHSPLCYTSTPYNLNNIPDLSQSYSLPNGILEGMNSRTSLALNDGSARSLSDCSLNCKGQYTSSVQTLWDRLNPKFGSSGKRQSLKLELPCISEENENVDEIADMIPKGIDSEGMTDSITKEPLADIIDNANPSTSALQDALTDGRADFVSSELKFSGIGNNVKKKHDKQSSNRRRFMSKGKENQSISLGVNGAKRTNELSGKDSMKGPGPTYSGRTSTRSNIVSNITSFIPLVQQKQAAAVVTGKRDIKVKALEAAEAAKRMAEKKENERKLKKEALRIERERLEQQNLKQLVLQKKKKEEERKKKEAEMAAKKRQREDEEKKEKERKRKRVNDTKKPQQEHGKIHTKKEERQTQCRPAGEEIQESKTLMDQRENQKNLQLHDIEEGNVEKISEAEPSTTRDFTNDKTLESCLEYSEAVNDRDAKGKVKGNFIEATQDGDLIIKSSLREQSYEISPYKGSDDEEEDEDDVPNNKFIPSWASKHRLSLAVSSRKMDPKTLFPRQSFCNVAEVLLPRKFQL